MTRWGAGSRTPPHWDRRIMSSIMSMSSSVSSSLSFIPVFDAGAAGDESTVSSLSTYATPGTLGTPRTPGTAACNGKKGGTGEDPRRMLHRPTAEGRRGGGRGGGSMTASTLLRALPRSPRVATDSSPLPREDREEGLPPSRNGGSGLPPRPSVRAFVLLLCPTRRIFELVQIAFRPRDATMGDLLDLVDAAATDDILRLQRRSGLCRPKDSTMDRIEKNALASLPARMLAGGGGGIDPRWEGGRATADVRRGEIL